MKIELDVSESQLIELDKSLTNFLSSLTDDQKLVLLQGYIEREFKNIYRENTTYYGSNSKELTEFGQQLVRGLQDKIAKVYVENYYMNNQEFKDKIDKECMHIQSNIQTIINDSISAYIIGHLFTDTDAIKQSVNNEVWKAVNQMRNNRGY